MANEAAKVPPCVQVEQNGACAVKALGAAMSVDGKTVRVDIYDRRNQVFPIAMSERDLCELLQVVGYMSQEMAAKQEELGARPDVHLPAWPGRPTAAPSAREDGWSPVNQSATIVVGNAGLQFPMDADTARSIGQALIDQAGPYKPPAAAERKSLDPGTGARSNRRRCAGIEAERAANHDIISGSAAHHLFGFGSRLLYMPYTGKREWIILRAILKFFTVADTRAGLFSAK
jgi:hypothetical protein